MRLKTSHWLCIALGTAAISIGAWSVTHAGDASAASSGHWEEVQEQAAARPIVAEGQLQPARVVNITAAFDGKVLKKWVVPGDEVAEGAPLVEIDTSELLSEHREAQAAQTRAAETLDDLQSWKSSAEVAAAQRQLAAAQTAVDMAKARRSETQSLFDKGIVARTELDSADTELRNATAQWHAASDGVATALRKGSPAQLRIAQLENDNKAAKAKLVASKMARAVVVAPRAGIVLAPPSDGQQPSVTAKEVEEGSMVSTKDVLMAIGDTSSFTVRGQLDEHDIVRVRPGLPVEVAMGTDDAVVLQGELRRVSSQARRNDSPGASASPPMFDIQVDVPKVSPQQRRHIRLGMTVRIRLNPDANLQALTVPLRAVTPAPQGAEVLRRSAASPDGERVAVKTGPTLADKVVVLQGLSPRDSVWVPRETNGAPAQPAP